MEEVAVSFGDSFEVIAPLSTELPLKRKMGPMTILSSDSISVTMKVKVRKVSDNRTNGRGDGLQVELDYFCNYSGQTVESSSDFILLDSEGYQFEENKILIVKEPGNDPMVRLEYKAQLSN